MCVIGQVTETEPTLAMTPETETVVNIIEKLLPTLAPPCHGGIARLEEKVINRIRSVGRVVRRPYSDSEESDNDVWYAEINNSALGQPTVDLCGEGCAQLDDFKWLLPTDECTGRSKCTGLGDRSIKQ